MNLHLVWQILAVAWIVLSLWMLWVNFLLLSILLMGIGDQGVRPLTVRGEALTVLFFAVSATAVGTWAFDSLGNVPCNVAYILGLLASYVITMLAVRVYLAHRDR